MQLQINWSEATLLAKAGYPGSAEQGLNPLDVKCLEKKIQNAAILNGAEMSNLF